MHYDPPSSPPFFRHKPNSTGNMFISLDKPKPTKLRHIDYSLLRKLLLNVRNCLPGIQMLWTNFGAVHNRMTTV